MNNTQQTWFFDPSYTTVEFATTELWFFKVKGSFEQVEGSIVLDEEDVTRSSVKALIKSSSVKTGNQRRDAKLRAGLLDAEHHPDIQFVSTNIARGTDRDMLDVKGTLILNGKSHPLFLSVSEMDRSRSPRGEDFVYYSATTQVDRHDFGFGSVPFLGRLLTVTINIQAIRQI